MYPWFFGWWVVAAAYWSKRYAHHARPILARRAGEPRSFELKGERWEKARA
jgi:hypothetical protein